MSEKNNEIAIKLNNLVKSADDPQSLLEAFGAPFEEAGEILKDYQLIKVSNASETALMLEARTKRLALKKVRTTVENKRKQLKEGILIQGRVIDNVAKFVKEVIEPAETYLQTQEDFVKIQEEARIDKIVNERLEKLSVYQIDLTLYNLRTMTDDQFDNLLNEQKTAEENRIKLEKAAEIEAIAERERQAKLEAENAQLRKEKEEAEKKLREKEAEERKIADEKIAAEKAAAEAEAKADSAPDKEKLIALAETVKAIQIPEMQSSSGKRVIVGIQNTLANIERSIRTLSNDL